MTVLLLSYLILMELRANRSNLDDPDYIPDLSRDYDVNHALPPTTEPTDDLSSSQNDSSSSTVAMPLQQLRKDRESLSILSSSCCTSRSSHDIEFIRPSSNSSRNSSDLLVNKNGKVMKNERFQQQPIKDFVDKIIQKDIENITHKIGKFVFGCNIPFNAIESKLKKNMINALRPSYSQYIPGRKKKNMASNTRTVVMMIHSPSGKCAFLKAWNITSLVESSKRLQEIVDESVEMAKMKYNVNVYAVVSDSSEYKTNGKSHTTLGSKIKFDQQYLITDENFLDLVRVEIKLMDSICEAINIYQQVNTSIADGAAKWLELNLETNVTKTLDSIGITSIFMFEASEDIFEKIQLKGERSKIQKHINSGASAKDATSMCKWEFFNSLKFMFPDNKDSLDVEESLEDDSLDSNINIIMDEDFNSDISVTTDESLT
ncbi:hypothetical protein PGB90_006348 [Kerria lacca]